MKKVLTPEQILLGKSLKKEGKTKRELAQMFEVGQTTIWENIFASGKRIRITKSIKRPRPIRIHCKRCDICLTREVKDNYVPLNFQIGEKCVSCYLEERGFEYIDIIQR